MVPTPQLTVIKLSDQERMSGVPTHLNIQNALEALHKDGIVCLQNAISVDHLDKLNAKMVPEAMELFKMSSTHHNFENSGNISQVPPVYKENLYADIFANPIAAKVLQNILGPKPQLRYLHGNTALRGKNRQPVHADLMFPHLDFPFAYVVNVLLVDASPKNGATEVWLGTHHWGNNGLKESPENPWIRSEALEERRKVIPPIQASVPKGSLIIRDLRLWHAGIPNQTDEPRIMLSMVHFPQWYNNKLRLRFPKSSEETVKALSKDIEIVADFIPDEEYNHLTIEFDADFSGGNVKIPERKPIDPMSAKLNGEKNHVEITVKEINCTPVPAAA